MAPRTGVLAQSGTFRVAITSAPQASSRDDGTIVLSDGDLRQLDLFAREFGITPLT